MPSPYSCARRIFKELWILFVTVSFLLFLEKRKCKMDLGLIVDTTKSIKEVNIPILQNALKHLIEEFDIGSDRTHVSLETFSNEATLHNKFSDEQYHNEAALLELITNSVNDLAQPTRLDKALVLSKDEMFAEENGLRSDAQTVVVLYTDGRSHPDTEDFFLDIIALKVNKKKRQSGINVTKRADRLLDIWSLNSRANFNSVI